MDEDTQNNIDWAARKTAHDLRNDLHPRADAVIRQFVYHLNGVGLRITRKPRRQTHGDDSTVET